MMPADFPERSITHAFNGHSQPVTAKHGTTSTKPPLAIATKLHFAQRIFKGKPVRTLSTKRVALQYRVVRPLQRIRITSKFGFRIHPITNKKTFHNGTDFAAKLNDKVFSVANGTVVRAGRRGSLGNSVEVVTGTSNLRTIFGHLNKVTVKAGQRVAAGQVIGLAGTTGRSTGVHLHLITKVAKSGISLNPAVVLTSAITAALSH